LCIPWQFAHVHHQKMHRNRPHRNLIYDRVSAVSIKSKKISQFEKNKPSIVQRSTMRCMYIILASLSFFAICPDGLFSLLLWQPSTKIAL
jgi:hypothetical protein